jgi:hypothetical protein
VKDKALKFKLKKSSRGFKFFMAYIFKIGSQLIMVSGIGNVKKAITEFSKMKKAGTEKTAIIQKVEIKASDLEKEIEI